MTVTAVTPEKEAEFLALVADGEYVTIAADKCGFSRQAIYRKKWADAAFAERLADAQRVGDEIQVERMEREADRRAVEGFDKGVYYEGERVDTERQFSDTLLIVRLKAKRPNVYRERTTVEHEGGITNRVLQADPMTEEQWAAKHGHKPLNGHKPLTNGHANGHANGKGNGSG